MNGSSIDIDCIVRNGLPSDGSFTGNELYSVLREYYPNLKKSTFYWQVHELKRKGKITSIKKGVYMLTVNKKVYEPLISNSQRKISKLIMKTYNDIAYCSWNSNRLNDFSKHQATNNVLLVNVERDMLKPVFHLLQDSNIKNLYLTPDSNIIDNYISEAKESVAIIPLITKSPIMEVSGIPVPTLEKMLVDVFCDDKLLNAYSGEELVIIYRNAFEEYVIDIARMRSYSRRRNKEHQLKKFLIDNEILDRELLDD